MPKVKDDYYDNKRKEIISAAFRVCKRKPITSVVMKDIISETGFSHGVVYKYYADLDEVLRELVISINKESNFNDKIDEALKESIKNWKGVVINICKMLSDHMKKMGCDFIKVSLYCDMLAISDPERVKRILKNISEENESPMNYLIYKLKKYLETVIEKKRLHPIFTVDEILQFMVVTYQGIQNGFVLSQEYDESQLKGNYNPDKMFSCLAQSIICMLDGKIVKARLRNEIKL